MYILAQGFESREHWLRKKRYESLVSIYTALSLKETLLVASRTDQIESLLQAPQLGAVPGIYISVDPV